MCHETLPEGYVEYDLIDLKNNKKQFWLVQIISVVIMIAMLVGGYFIVGIDDLEQDGLTTTIIGLVVLIAGFIAYIVLHEAVHGIVMYLSCRVKPKFGFVGWAAYAGSTAYYDKKHYIVIALAPLVVFGIIFAVLNVFFHSGVWFWVIWMLQIGNVSGAAGDIFCTFKMFGYPKDILVQDTGLAMTVYSKQAKEANKKSSDIQQTETDNGDLN